MRDRKDPRDGFGYRAERENKSEPTEQHRHEGKIQDNYDDFMNRDTNPYMIGFICSVDDDSPFSPSSIGIVDSLIVNGKCRHFDVQFKVHYGKLKFGKDKQFEVAGVWTEKVDIAKRLPANGFASYCCYDEAETMEKGIIEMCKKQDLMICRKQCSWPIAVAVVQPNHFKN